MDMSLLLNLIFYGYVTLSLFFQFTFFIHFDHHFFFHWFNHQKRSIPIVLCLCICCYWPFTLSKSYSIPIGRIWQCLWVSFEQKRHDESTSSFITRPRLIKEFFLKNKGNLIVANKSPIVAFAFYKAIITRISIQLGLLSSWVELGLAFGPFYFELSITLSWTILFNYWSNLI